MPLLPPIEPWHPAPLQDRVVLVTGGAQGIGRGIAQAVLGAGGHVAIADLDAEAGRACLREWNLPRRSLFRRVDATRERGVAAFVQAALDRFGRIDGLVNNAGLPDPHVAPLDRLDTAGWNRGLSSLHAAFLCSRHALPALRHAADGGAIVNIASTRAHQSEPHSEAYAAAKGGLLAFTHALALSEGPAVRVNCISPGWIATDAWRAPARRRAPRLSARDHAQHPAGRVGTPRDVAALAVWLLSPALSGFVTGQEFVADGGMSRKMQYA
ncbi:MAG TPA: SDR family oxidoreductase [Pseudoxanthomonas sp.]|nr:SDR family oxidoreductase [Pseudoxanthomonas sp.]